MIKGFEIGILWMGLTIIFIYNTDRGRFDRLEGKVTTEAKYCAAGCEYWGRDYN